MSLVDLAMHLENEGVGVQGSTIFVDVLPPEVKTGVMLRQYGGIADPDLQELYRTDVQVVARASEYEEARALAMSVRTKLVIRQKQIGTTWFYQVLATSEPASMGRDNSGLHTFVINFEATWR
jgi:hypothetical protein